MSRPALLIGLDAHEIVIACAVLREARPALRPVHVPDAVAFATAFAGEAPALAVVARETGWGGAPEIVGALRRRHPDCAVVMLGEPVAAVIDPAMQPDVHLPRDVSGFGRLGEAAGRAIASRRRAVEPAGDAILLASLPVAVLRLSERGHVVAANDVAARLLGFVGAGALVGTPITDLVVRAGDAAPGSFDALAEECGEGVAVEVRAAGGDGVACRLRTRADPGGGFLATLSPLAAEGDEADLVLAVSHDLREPLTMIELSTRMLAERLASSDADGQRMLGRIASGVSRLDARLSALLDFARGRRTALVRDRFPLRELAEEIVHGLQPALEQAGATVRLGELPEIVASRAEVARLLENLLANAIKFRAERPPVIDVACVERGDTWQLSVADNGIGVDMSQAERVFEPFQRLHSAAEFPGSGIGLAICRQICERHGGRIWVEANPGGGATFNATLARPVAPAPEG